MLEGGAGTVKFLIVVVVIPQGAFAICQNRMIHQRVHFAVYKLFLNNNNK